MKKKSTKSAPKKASVKQTSKVTTKTSTKKKVTKKPKGAKAKKDPISHDVNAWLSFSNLKVKPQDNGFVVKGDIDSKQSKPADPGAIGPPLDHYVFIATYTKGNDVYEGPLSFTAPTLPTSGKINAILTKRKTKTKSPGTVADELVVTILVSKKLNFSG